jgi:hypothetical protein
MLRRGGRGQTKRKRRDGKKVKVKARPALLPW